MGRRSGTSSRAKALAKAAEAIARRDAERIAREKAVQEALTDFFHAQGQVERIHREADAAIAPYDATMRDAVRALNALDEGRADIAELTGLPLSRIREYLVDTETSSTTVAPGADTPVEALTGRRDASMRTVS